MLAKEKIILETIQLPLETTYRVTITRSSAQSERQCKARSVLQKT